MQATERKLQLESCIKFFCELEARVWEMEALGSKVVVNWQFTDFLKDMSAAESYARANLPMST